MGRCRRVPCSWRAEGPIEPVCLTYCSLPSIRSSHCVVQGSARHMQLSTVAPAACCSSASPRTRSRAAAAQLPSPPGARWAGSSSGGGGSGSLRQRAALQQRQEVQRLWRARSVVDEAGATMTVDSSTDEGRVGALPSAAGAACAPPAGGAVLLPLHAGEPAAMPMHVSCNPPRMLQSTISASRQLSQQHRRQASSCSPRLRYWS